MTDTKTEKDEATANAEKAARGIGKALASVAVFAFLGGLFLMLLLGIVHLNIAAAVPALGYWTCVPLILLARLVRGSLCNTTAPRKVAIDPMALTVDPSGIARLAMRGERDLARA